MKRRPKPKTMLLSDRSSRSVARLAAALAFTKPEGDTTRDYLLRNRASEILRLLREMA